MTDDNVEARRTVWRWLCAALALGLLYLLSFAPMTRLSATHIPAGSANSPDGATTIWGKITLYETDRPFYAPARWLTRETPLREPLLMWADLWGVRMVLEP